MKKHLPPDGPVPGYSVWTFPLKFSSPSRWGCVAGCQDQLMLEFFFPSFFVLMRENFFKIKLFILFQVERKEYFFGKERKIGFLVCPVHFSLPFKLLFPGVISYLSCIVILIFSLLLCIMYLLFVFFSLSCPILLLFFLFAPF